MSDRNEAMVSRLNQLEKTNRRMKVLGLAALAIFGMAATQSHSDDHEVIRAQRFQVVDNRGNVLADLGTFGNKNHPGLFFYDGKGVPRESLGIDPKSDNSGDAAYDHKGIVRTFTGAIETGTAKGLSGEFAYDKDGAPRAAIVVDPEHDFIGFSSLDANGRARVTSSTKSDGSGESFALNDANQTTRMAMAVDYDSTGGEGQFLWDKDGVLRIDMSIDDTNFGGTGSEDLFFNNNNFHNNVDNSVVGAFISGPGEGGSFFTADTHGTPTGSLPPSP
jgi:hypothetical protein